MLDTKNMMTNELFPSLSRKSDDAMFYIIMMFADNDMTLQFIKLLIQVYSILNDNAMNLFDFKKIIPNIIYFNELSQYSIQY